MFEDVMFISLTWTPTPGEELQCITEDSNDKDPYTVAVMQTSQVIYHLMIC